MPSSPNNSCSSSKPKPKANKKSSFGFKRGFLTNNVSSLSSSSGLSTTADTTTNKNATAARCGHENAMDTLMKCYRQGLLSNEDLATTFRAYQAAMEAVTSEPREYAKRYNKFVTKLFETRNMNIKNYS